MAHLPPTSPLVDRLFGPIEDRATARTLARDLGVGLLVVAALQAILALASGRDALVDAALLAVSGVLVWATPGRFAAVVALLVACGSAALSIATLTIHTPASRGRSILLGLIAVWIAGRAVVAALALRRLSRADRPRDGDGDEPPAGTAS